MEEKITVIQHSHEGIGLNGAEAQFYVISLRPFLPDRTVRLVVLEPWALEPIPDSLPLDATPDIVIVTSPYAATLTHNIYPRTKFYAPGRGTAAALHANGIETVFTPVDETSDGLMDLPGLQDVHGKNTLILGAAGGRGIIQRKLRERGAVVDDRFIYTRTKIKPSLAEWHEARETLPGVLLVSSLNALVALDEGLNGEDRAQLRSLPLVASSDRIADAAREMGFGEVIVAGTPQPNEMLRVTPFS